MRKKTRLLTTLFVVFATGPGVAAADPAPPPGSPMALGQRPRIFFTTADIPGIRQRIADHYRLEFQQLLDLLGDPTRLTSAQRQYEADWGSMNAALVAVLDPVALAGLGFTLPSHLSSKPALCSMAMNYARTQLPSIADAKGLGHSALTTGYSYALYLPVAATYDWCHGELSNADRTEIADAIVAGFNKKYAGKNPLTIKINGLERLANNQAAINIHDILGVLAIWGDPHQTAALQAEMYNTFDTLWHRRAMNELLIFYEHGTHWHEGPGGYFNESFTSLATGFAAMSSALSTPYAAQLPLFLRFGAFVQAVTRPNTIASTCGPSGRDRCEPYYDRWGTISGGISGPSCSPMMLAAGMLRVAGQVQAAGLLKWGIDDTKGDCLDDGRQYGGTWYNGWKWFLYGDRGIQALSPESIALPLALKHGLGLYSMRSGYDATSSQVLFYAQPFNTYGHGTPDYGTFSLHKYGNLILQAANTKSGDGALSYPSGTPTIHTLSRNVLTLHKGATDPGLSFDASGPVEPRFQALGIMSSIRLAGDVLAESLNAQGFDYVLYDNTYKFSSSTATVSQRELLHLRGPENHQFLVVFDRFNAVSPQSNQKVWRIWVPTQPEFVNGVVSQPRAGKWTSPTSDTISLTNRFGPLTGNQFRGGPTRGRFFMKTLSPASPVISFQGGDNAEFQSGDDDGSTPWGTPVMTQAAREYVGWGRVEVRPSVLAPYDTFLNVIQFGEADGLTLMAPTFRVTSSDSRMLGAHIADPTNEWVALFAEQPASLFQIDEVAYTFRPSAPSSRHVLANMMKGTTFHVRSASDASGTVVTLSRTPQTGSIAVASDAGGLVSFSLAGLTVTPYVVPRSPQNVRIVHQ